MAAKHQKGENVGGQRRCPLKHSGARGKRPVSGVGVNPRPVLAYFFGHPKAGNLRSAIVQPRIGWSLLRFDEDQRTSDSMKIEERLASRALERVKKMWPVKEAFRKYRIARSDISVANSQDPPKLSRDGGVSATPALQAALSILPAMRPGGR
jgi:hypothetical protein